MRFSHRPQNDLPLTESLEPRTLLSVVGKEDIGRDFVFSGGTVELIDFEREREDEGNEQSIRASELPAAVRRALEARFPGAVIEEAETSVEEGEREYSIEGTYAGKLLDVTFSPKGRVLEVEEHLTTDQLPEPILAALNDLLSGVEIEEAVLVVEGNTQFYEISFVEQPGEETEVSFTMEPNTAIDPDGTQPIEAVQTDVVRTDDADAVENLPGEEAIEVNSADAAAFDVVTSEAPISPEIAAVIHAAQRAGMQAVLLTVDPLTAIVETALPASAMTVRMGEMLIDAMPVDIAAIEQRLRQIAADLKALAGQASATDRGMLITEFAIAGGVLLSAIVAIESRKRRVGAGALSCTATNSSWSWVLGGSAVKR